jgi:mono/diheme cytochrome c family protein
MLRCLTASEANAQYKTWRFMLDGARGVVREEMAALKREVFPRHMKRLITIFLLASWAITISACSKDSDRSSRSGNSDWERGRAVYVANCVACHNTDPSKDGPIGPAIQGSPKELVESRVLRTDYPPGYKPKRNTKVMPTFPFLKNDIPYLTAYLSNSSTH